LSTSASYLSPNFSAALDTIDHAILLDRLSLRFGIYGIALNWFKSYLPDRPFCVQCSHNLSEPHGSCYGVLQSKVSVLGPPSFHTTHAIPLLSGYVFPRSYSITTYTLMTPSRLFPSSLLVLMKTSLASVSLLFKLVSSYHKD